MIVDGYITREQHEGYIKNMHERMWTVFDRFISEIVPNNVIKQYNFFPGEKDGGIKNVEITRKSNIFNHP